MELNMSTTFDAMIGSRVANNVYVDTNHSLDTSDIVRSDEYHLQMTRFIVQRILVPVITFVGVFGNIMSICVLVQRSMLSSTNCYLTALSVFDLLYLIFSFTLSWKHYKTIKTLDAYIYWFPYGRVFVDISANVSVYLTVTFSFERLIAVCFPMKGRIICTPKRAKIISLIVVLVVSALTSLELFEWKTIHISDGNITKLEITDTEFAKSNFYRIGYYYFLIICFTILPLVLLTVFNGVLIKSVFKAIKLRRQMTQVSAQTPSDTTRRHREQQKITAMLVGVVVVFLICQTPNAVLLIYHTYLHLQGQETSPKQRNYLRIAGNIVNLLILTNSSINFVIYSCMSTKFRRVFLRLFCRFSTYAKRDITRTYTSYYGNTALTSRSPKSSIRERRSSLSCRVYGKRTHSGQIADEKAVNTEINACKWEEKRSSLGFVHLKSLPNMNEIRKSQYRPHIKYSVCEHNSDSDDLERTQTDWSLDEMARARERGSQRCQCFHIKTLRCLDSEDSTGCTAKIADTTI